MEKEINTINKFMVGVLGDNISIINLPALAKPISKSDALMLAAWLVCLADDNDEFQNILKACLNT